VSPEEVDNGSSDPDGDPVTLSLSPGGPYAVGDTEVTLTVADPEGLEDTCQTTVTVIDQTPPVVTCSVTPVGDDDDDHGDLLAVEFEATDNCSIGQTQALLDVRCQQIQLSSGEVVELKCEGSGSTCKVERKNGHLKIKTHLASLTVTGIDGAGNLGQCTLDLCVVGDDDDDD
jgi:hypothetical protein